ncbi:hypothetical protein ACQK5W_00320 [Pantoea sp. FN060301]|uniref:hypothetical protein n=1 Tax=Pantoea sp. FN060301 TaxID=3420380 RepID=UPI003D18502D
MEITLSVLKKFQRTAQDDRTTRLWGFFACRANSEISEKHKRKNGQIIKSTKRIIPCVISVIGTIRALSGSSEKQALVVKKRLLFKVDLKARQV